MLVLASLYRDWCMKAWDEVQDDEVGYWIGEFEFLPLGVGQLIGADDDLSTDPHEALAEAIETLMARERKAVVEALLSGFGGVDGLFVALWSSNQAPDAQATAPPRGNERAEHSEQTSLFDSEDDNDLDDDDYDDDGDEPETDADILNDMTALKMNAYEWIDSGCESLVPLDFGAMNRLGVDSRVGTLTKLVHVCSRRTRRMMKPMSEPNSKPLLTPEERAALPPPPKPDSAHLERMRRRYPQGFRAWAHEGLSEGSGSPVRQDASRGSSPAAAEVTPPAEEPPFLVVRPSAHVHRPARLGRHLVRRPTGQRPPHDRRELRIQVRGEAGEAHPRRPQEGRLALEPAHEGLVSQARPRHRGLSPPRRGHPRGGPRRVRLSRQAARCDRPRRLGPTYAIPSGTRTRVIGPKAPRNGGGAEGADARPACGTPPSCVCNVALVPAPASARTGALAVWSMPLSPGFPPRARSPPVMRVPTSLCTGPRGRVARSNATTSADDAFRRPPALAVPFREPESPRRTGAGGSRRSLPQRPPAAGQPGAAARAWPAARRAPPR